jgi:hypothetical protein
LEMPARRFADSRSAMAAYIIEGMRASGGIARNYQTLAGDIGDEIISRILQLLGTPDAQPRLPKDAIALLFEDFRRHVPSRRKGQRAIADGRLNERIHGASPPHQSDKNRMTARIRTCLTESPAEKRFVRVEFKFSVNAFGKVPWLTE